MEKPELPTIVEIDEFCGSCAHNDNASALCKSRIPAGTHKFADFVDFTHQQRRVVEEACGERKDIE